MAGFVEKMIAGGLFLSGCDAARRRAAKIARLASMRSREMLDTSRGRRERSVAKYVFACAPAEGKLPSCDFRLFQKHCALGAVHARFRRDLNRAKRRLPHATRLNGDGGTPP